MMTIARIVGAFVLAVLFVPLLVTGQTPRAVPRIGFLQTFPSVNDLRFEAFRQRLRELGYTEGKNVTIDYRSAEQQYDRLPTLAAELVRRNVDVIVTDGGTPPAVAAMNATRTIPIVFVAVADPVGHGMVASIARPGGNLTGLTGLHREFAPKSLELFKEMIPSARRIAMLSNPTNSSLPAVLREMQTAATALHLELRVVNARGPDEFDRAFVEMARDRPSGVYILTDTLFISQAARLIALAAKHRLPTMGGHNVIPEKGGLASYGPDRLDMVRRAAVFVDKILKGAKVGELPVEQPLTFNLIINVKAAKALGLTVPRSVLLQADRIIE